MSSMPLEIGALTLSRRNLSEHCVCTLLYSNELGLWPWPRHVDLFFPSRCLGAADPVDGGLGIVVFLFFKRADTAISMFGAPEPDGWRTIFLMADASLERAACGEPGGRRLSRRHDR